MTVIDMKYDVSQQLVSLNSEVSWIQTYSGKKIFALNPDPDNIDVIDIAHSLSHQCRFTGHTQKFYSIAQHSVLVSFICDEVDALWGCCHDNSEYILVDLPSPIKKLPEFAIYRLIEKRVQGIICQKFGLDVNEPPSVKRADMQLLATEARDLLSPLHPDFQTVEPLPFKIDPWSPEKAEKEYLKRFHELYKG